MIITPFLVALMAFTAPPFKCPPGTQMIGDAPPKGMGAYCQKRLPDGEFVKHGPVKEWNTYGLLTAEANFVDGVPEGSYVSYYGGYFDSARGWIDSKNQIREKGAFESGKRVGVWRKFHPGGTVSFEATFEKGILTGNLQEKSSDGQLLVDLNFKAGVAHGRQRRWYDNGSPSIEVEYVDGLASGPCIAWMEDGQVRSRGQFVAGKPDGDWFHRESILYDNTNFKEMRGTFTNGLREGTWITTDLINNKIVVVFKNGVADKDCEEWRDGKKYEYEEKMSGNPYTGGRRLHSSQTSCSNNQMPDPMDLLAYALKPANSIE